MTCHLWDIWPCWTFSLHCSQRLILYLNNLFYFCEHFQTHRFLVKHWRKYDKRQSTKVSQRWKWFHWSHISSKIPAASSHLTPFHSHFLPGWKLVHGREDDRQSTAHELIVKMKKCWHFGGKISIPPHTSVPPGLRLTGFHLPSSSPCHQEVAGRGYLLPRSQWYDIWYNII